MRSRNSAPAVLAALLLLLVACTRDDTPKPSNQTITVPDLTGLSRKNAVDLIDQLDIDIDIQRIDVTEIDSAPRAPGVVVGGQFAGDAVLKQDPPPDTKVEPRATVTLFVPYGRPLRPGETRFRLLTHCGLSYPLEFDNRFWLPVDAKLRRTINPPEGFHSDGYYDVGRVRPIDHDTVMYTSSVGIEVEYEPTKKRPQGC